MKYLDRGRYSALRALALAFRTLFNGKLHQGGG